MRKFLSLVLSLMVMVVIAGCPSPTPPVPADTTVVVDTTVLPVDTTVVVNPPPPSNPAVVVTASADSLVVSGTVEELGVPVPNAPIRIIATTKNAPTVYGNANAFGNFTINMTGSVYGQYKVCAVVRGDDYCSLTVVSIPSF
jgi:hypothetical protein